MGLAILLHQNLKYLSLSSFSLPPISCRYKRNTNFCFLNRVWVMCQQQTMLQVLVPDELVNASTIVHSGSVLRNRQCVRKQPKNPRKMFRAINRLPSVQKRTPLRHLILHPLPGCCQSLLGTSMLLLLQPQQTETLS